MDPPPLTGLCFYSQCPHRHWKEASGRLIGPSQRHLPDNTQHSREKDILASDEIRTRNSSKQAAAERVSSGIGSFSSLDGTSGFIRSAKYLWVSAEFWYGTRSNGRVHKAALDCSANPDILIRICHCCECQLLTCEHQHFFFCQFYVNKSQFKLVTYNFLNAITTTLQASKLVRLGQKWLSLVCVYTS
jgi:hypothetical protein